jgi:hypothetical protein
MWEKIRSANIEDAKAQLSRKRAEALSRQAEELERLDAQLRDIDTFEQVVAAFFEEYMDEDAGSVPSASIHGQLPAASLPERDEPSTQGPQNAPSLALQIRQTILPNFKILPRARRLIGVSSR